ncbi:MAG: peptidylprolyl isomerase [Leptonema sp. (in: bacteria)]
MKNFYKLLLIFLIFFQILFAEDQVDYGEELNSIYLTVGKKVITKLEIQNIATFAKFLSDLENRKISPENFLIEKAIVEQIAEEDSIMVSEERLKLEIEKRKLSSNIVSNEDFKKHIEKETGLTFELWKEILKYQLLKQQIIQIRIPIPQPTEEEIENFYKKNSRQIGIEVLYREILFPPTKSIIEEKKTYQIASEVYLELQKNPEKFSEIASTLKENVSPYKASGGIRLWIPIIDVAKEDPILAGAIFNTSINSITPIFKNQNQQYTIIKVEGKRTVPFEKVREMIRIRLFYEKAEEAFQKWIEDKKRNFIIKKL